MTVTVTDLGTWGAAALLAEYDPEDDAIRVNARAVACVAAALGPQQARRFVACAVAHERFHRERPGAGEDEARAYARDRCGFDPDGYETVLRAAGWT